jgi:hypothetical protein
MSLTKCFIVAKVDMGELRVYDTDSPNNFSLGDQDTKMVVSLTMGLEKPSVEITGPDGRKMLHVSASIGVMRGLMDRVLMRKMGKPDENVNNMMCVKIFTCS